MLFMQVLTTVVRRWQTMYSVSGGRVVTGMDKPHNFGALIRIEDAIKVLCRKTCHPGAFCPDVYCSEMWEAFDDVERVDVIPAGAYVQVRWERDTAVEQLRKLGYTLGEKVTPIVRCKDCKHFVEIYPRMGRGFCFKGEWYRPPQDADDFCSDGKRKEGDGDGAY